MATYIKTDLFHNVGKTINSFFENILNMCFIYLN